MDKNENWLRPVSKIFGGSAIAGMAGNALGIGDSAEMVGAVANAVIDNKIAESTIKRVIDDNRPIPYDVLNDNKLGSDVRAMHVSNIFHANPDANILKKLGSYAIDKALSSDPKTIKAALQPPAASRLTPAAACFIGGGRSFWNNGYKRRYFNRRNFSNNYRRGRFNRKYYKTNSRKTFNRRRKFRKYFRKY